MEPKSMTLNLISNLCHHRVFYYNHTMKEISTLCELMDNWDILFNLSNFKCN